MLKKINILEERQIQWLIKLNQYDKNTQQFVKTFKLPNNDDKSNYRCQVKENEATNVSNWNQQFNKLKETYFEE